MALTVTRTKPTTVFGNQRVSRATITFDSSYPTGGESLTPSDLGLKRIAHAHAQVKTPSAVAAAAVTSVPYDVTNSKLKLNAVAAEVANTTDCSALVVELVAYGS